MTGWDAFAKYVGIQGVLALLLIGGFLYQTIVGAVVSDAYTGIMGAVIGYYFAKNGVGILDIISKKNVKG